MTDQFDVESSIAAVLTDDEKPDNWEELSLAEKLDYIEQVVDGERA